MIHTVDRRTCSATQVVSRAEGSLVDWCNLCAVVALASSFFHHRDVIMFEILAAAQLAKENENVGGIKIFILCFLQNVSPDILLLPNSGLCLLR